MDWERRDLIAEAPVVSRPDSGPGKHERKMHVKELVGRDGARERVVELVELAEAIVEGWEKDTVDGRWAMTAFSRYRLCELLGVLPYGPYDGVLEGDPVALLEEAAGLVDEIEVPVEDLSWRLALGDALRTAAGDIRMVRLPTCWEPNCRTACRAPGPRRRS